jgi:uncharacterized SAM-dependent methyltransferase
VYLESVDETISFEKWETIHTEISQKYSPGMISRLAGEGGFEIIQTFYDSRNYFSNSLWKVKY